MRSRVRIWYLGEGEDREGWARALAAGDWRQGVSLKLDDRGRGVWRTRVMGEDAIIKSRPLEGFWGCVRSRFGATDLMKATLGAALLEAKGFATPRVRLTGMCKQGDTWHEVLVMEPAPGESLLSLWVHGDARSRRALAQKAGAALGALSRSGIFNRDAKPSNWLISGEDIHFIDVGGVRTAGGGRSKELARMIAALGFEPTGVNAPPTFQETALAVRSALGASGLSHPDKRRTLARLRALIKEHGDPAPKDHPLAHELQMR